LHGRGTFLSAILSGCTAFIACLLNAFVDRAFMRLSRQRANWVLQQDSVRVRSMWAATGHMWAFSDMSATLHVEAFLPLPPRRFSRWRWRRQRKTEGTETQRHLILRAFGVSSCWRTDYIHRPCGSAGRTPIGKCNTAGDSSPCAKRVGLLQGTFGTSPVL